MEYKVSAEPAHLRAELHRRETVEETQAFLRAVVQENARYRRACVLIVVRHSKPVFQVSAHRLIDYFEVLHDKGAHSIALFGDTRDLDMSHQYIELLARQRGLNVRSFVRESAALAWLKDRREPRGRRNLRERRQLGERRRQERRAGAPAPQPA